MEKIAKKEVILPEYFITFKETLDEIKKLAEEKLTQKERTKKENFFKKKIYQTFLFDIQKELGKYKGQKFVFVYQGALPRLSHKHTFGKGRGTNWTHFDTSFQGIISSKINKIDWVYDSSSFNNSFPISLQGFFVREKFGLYRKWERINTSFYFVFPDLLTEERPEWNLFELIQPFIPQTEEFKEFLPSRQLDAFIGMMPPKISWYFGDKAVEKFFVENPEFK